MFKSKEFFVSLLKGVFIILFISLATVLLFSFVIKAFSLSSQVIKPINVLIKTVAVFTGCLFSVKGEKGFVKGGIIGFVAMILSYLLFGVIGGNLIFKVDFIWEVLLGLVIGAISGICAVNIRNKY